MSDRPSLEVVLTRALDAYAALSEVAEEIDDEWTYLNDLTDAWRSRIEATAARRGDESVDPATEAAIERAIDEVGSITDPHRAIDWLSTFPQVVLIAVGDVP